PPSSDRSFPRKMKSGTTGRDHWGKSKPDSSSSPDYSKFERTDRPTEDQSPQAAIRPDKPAAQRRLTHPQTIRSQPIPVGGTRRAAKNRARSDYARFRR